MGLQNIRKKMQNLRKYRGSNGGNGRIWGQKERERERNEEKEKENEKEE